MVRGYNQQLFRGNHITYNISSSTPPQHVLDAVIQNSPDAQLDCMLCISIFYNQQNFDVERPPKLTRHLSISHDYLHNISERPRQLTTFDLCPKTMDSDWHLPLICRISSHATKNKRTRGPDSQGYRQQRYRDWRNRQDQQWRGHPPTWNEQQWTDQHWTDQQWYQDQGCQEDHYRHPTGRYYERPGPYTSHGSSSSSSAAPRWEGWYGGLR